MNPMFQSFAEIMDEVIEVKELVGGIVQGGCTCQLFGPSGDGKTFIAIDLGLSVATGSDWNGMPCKPGLVVYFNGEGRHGFKLRLRAWRKYHGYAGSPAFYASKKVITFDEAGIALAVAEIQRIEEQTNQKVALIIIDTLARHITGDENSTQDMGEFIRQVDGLRDLFSDSTAMLVHHTGNSAEAKGRGRGSSALKAALDIEIQCMDYCLTFTKCKDIEAPEPIDFKLQIIEVGRKENGEAITSCAVVYGEKPAKARAAAVKKIDGSNKCLLEIIEKHVTGEVEEIRPLFYAAEKSRLNEPDRKQGTLKTTFSRSIIFLIGQKIITQDGSILQTAQTAQDGTNGNCTGRANGTNGTPL
jgi:hypothetical protein